MTTLMQASRQWATRPADERFLSLLELQAFTHRQLDNSRSSVFSSRKLEVLPDETDPKMRGLLVGNPDGTVAAPTHWSFGQLCTLAATPSPASYFRDSKLPSPIIADCLNFNLRFTRDVEDVGVLITRQDAEAELRAATGPRYGRIWNAHVADALVERFGDGVSGHWRVPGEFGNRVQVDNNNTTLYASDRNMFVFLADEDRRIEIPGRRNGRPGSLARGFFVWNSEVGDTTLGVGFFLFDYVCCNRIVWGADQYAEVRIRHTARRPRPVAGRSHPSAHRIFGGLGATGAAGDRRRPRQARRGRSQQVPRQSVWQIHGPGHQGRS
jgi:hypothetical protein